MRNLYFARYLFMVWTLVGVVGYFICWGIEKREGFDMSAFRSVEVTLILICFALVWVLLNTIIGKYDKDKSALKKASKEKTRKEKILDMILLYWLLLIFIVPILCYIVGISGWEFLLVEFVCYVMLRIMGKIYNKLGLGSVIEIQDDEQSY